MKKDPAVSIKLFGAPKLTNSSPNMFPAKGFLLLAVLISTPGHRIQRTKLANLLWDSTGDVEALTNLRQLIARVRRKSHLTGDLVETNTGEVWLGADAVAVDLFKFYQLSASERSADLVRAIYLYQSDLLADVEEPTASFATWLSVERAVLRKRLFTILNGALVELTRYGRASSDDLVRLADHVFQIDREREESYRAFIEAYGRNGMYGEARDLYQSLVDVLRREYGEQPSQETEAVARRVFAASSGIVSLETRRAEALADNDQRPRVAMLAVVDPVEGGREALFNALMEDVANELSRYRTFVILAPHSSQQVDHTSGIPNQNDILKADYTISGFLKPGNRGSTLAIRMTNCQTSEVVWAAEYPARPERLVRTFNVLSAQIASSVAAELEREMLEALKFCGGGNAYLYYLQGQVDLKTCTLHGVRSARKQFERAFKVDRGFALACGRVAQTLYLEWLMLGGDDPQLLLHAREYAKRAAELDTGAAIGFWIGGVIDLYQHNYAQSADKFTEAEALNPNCADLIVQHADALSHFGEADVGWEKFKAAIDLNPLPPDHYWWAGASIAFVREQYDDAIALCNRMTDIEPVVRLLAASHGLAGNMAEARSYGNLVKEMYPSRAAAEISKLVPAKVVEDGKRFAEGLRIAGV